MIFQSTRFGQIEVDESKTIDIAEGLLGFPEKRFVLLTPEGIGPFHWLHAVDNPDLAFVVVDPSRFVQGYRVRIGGEDCRKLELKDGEDPTVLALVTMSADPSKISMNLKGPILLNHNSRKGVQLVQEDSSLTTKYLLFPPAPAEEVPRAAAGGCK